MLSAVLEPEERADVLKIDSEGSDLPIIEAVRPDLQRRISTVYLELEPTGQTHADVRAAAARFHLPAHPADVLRRVSLLPESVPASRRTSA